MTVAEPGVWPGLMSRGRQAAAAPESGDGVRTRGPGYPPGGQRPTRRTGIRTGRRQRRRSVLAAELPTGPEGGGQDDEDGERAGRGVDLERPVGPDRAGDRCRCRRRRSDRSGRREQEAGRTKRRMPRARRMWPRASETSSPSAGVSMSSDHAWSCHQHRPVTAEEESGDEGGRPLRAEGDGVPGDLVPRTRKDRARRA